MLIARPPLRWPARSAARQLVDARAFGNWERAHACCSRLLGRLCSCEATAALASAAVAAGRRQRTQRQCAMHCCRWSGRCVRPEMTAVRSRVPRSSLDGAWRLVFTTGTIDTRASLGARSTTRSRNDAVIRARTKAITNGICGRFCPLEFFGTFDRLEDRRGSSLTSIDHAWIQIDLPTGGARGARRSDRSRLEEQRSTIQEGQEGFLCERHRPLTGRGGFWLCIMMPRVLCCRIGSAPAMRCHCRGGGGGLALWRRDTEMKYELRVGRGA